MQHTDRPKQPGIKHVFRSGRDGRQSTDVTAPWYVIHNAKAAMGAKGSSRRSEYFAVRIILRALPNFATFALKRKAAASQRSAV